MNETSANLSFATTGLAQVASPVLKHTPTIGFWQGPWSGTICCIGMRKFIHAGMHRQRDLRVPLFIFRRKMMLDAIGGSNTDCAGMISAV
jgi:hypothetical protein